MAKAKTESVRAREARLKAEAEAAAAAEAAGVEAAAAAEAARAEAARLKAERNAPKPKRPRFVRAEKVEQPVAAAVPLPPPTSTPLGKLLSKVAKPAPKVAAAGPNRGPAAPREKRQVRHEGVSRK